MRVSIVDPYKVIYHKWWSNFLAYAFRSKAKPVNTSLNEFNATYNYKWDYVEFDTEADAAAFILKWS